MTAFAIIFNQTLHNLNFLKIKFYFNTNIRLIVKKVCIFLNKYRASHPDAFGPLVRGRSFKEVRDELYKATIERNKELEKLLK